TQGGGVDAEARLHGGQGLRLLQAPQAGHHRVKKVEQQQAGILIVEQLPVPGAVPRSEEHTSELQSRFDLVCRLLLEKKKQQEARRRRMGRRVIRLYIYIAALKVDKVSRAQAQRLVLFAHVARRRGAMRARESTATSA